MDESRLRGPKVRRSGRNRVTIYIADQDMDVWERADEYVRKHHVSLSSLVAEALAKFLEQH